MSTRLSRRTLLRGALGGAALAVGVPLLDIFLNDHGDALAQDQPLPLRFGTWFWGCGMNPGQWEPQREGSDYDLPPELQALAPVRSQVTVLTGFNAFLDGTPNTPHASGVLANLTGTAPADDVELPGPTLDTRIAAHFAGQTRFRSLELSSCGTENSFSRISQGAVNPSESDPLTLYTRLFGPEFHAPGDGEFVPDPRTLLRQSVLSSIREDRQRFAQGLGSHDRQRLDQYFTSIRQLEQQLDVLLAGPPDLAACSRPEAPASQETGNELSQVIATHGVMADLLALALACDQTRVFNLMFCEPISELRVEGQSVAHHQLTHDEPLDPALGYQPGVSVFTRGAMQAWSALVQRLAAVPEGDGSLLDHCFVFAHSDHGFAKVHDIVGLPMMIAGSAGGRLRPGLHLRGAGEPVTRVGLTLQQVAGLNVESFGSRSMQVDNPISEIQT